MKRVLSLIMVLAMVLVMVPFSASAATELTFDEYGSIMESLTPGAYTASWSAPSDGVAEFSMGNFVENGYIVTITDKNGANVAITEDEYGGNAASANVAAGDSFTFNVIVTAEEAFVYISANCEAPKGAESNPYILHAYDEAPVLTAPATGSAWHSVFYTDLDYVHIYENMVVESADVKVIVGETTYQAAEGETSFKVPMTAAPSGMAVTAMEVASLTGAAVEAPVSFTDKVNPFPEGSASNPKVVTPFYGMLPLSAKLEAGAMEPYYYQWTNDGAEPVVVSFKAYEAEGKDIVANVIVSDDDLATIYSLIETVEVNDEYVESYNYPVNTALVPVGATVKFELGAQPDNNWNYPAVNISADATIYTEEELALETTFSPISIDNGGKVYVSTVSAGSEVSFQGSRNNSLVGKTLVITSNSGEDDWDTGEWIPYDMANAEVKAFDANYDIVTYTDEDKDGDIEVPLVGQGWFSIVNKDISNANFVMQLVLPEGAIGNEKEIAELGDLEVTTVSGLEDGYNILWTATADGLLTADMGEIELLEQAMGVRPVVSIVNVENDEDYADNGWAGDDFASLYVTEGETYRITVKIGGFRGGAYAAKVPVSLSLNEKIVAKLSYYDAENYVDVVKYFEDVNLAVADAPTESYANGEKGIFAEQAIVTLLKDAIGGFDIGVEKYPLETNFRTQNIILDLNGHTLTVGHPPVGSSGTKTNGIRVLAFSQLVVKDGTIVSDNGVKRGIQNYGEVTVEDVTFVNGETMLDTIGNFGTTTLSGKTLVPNGSDSAILNSTYMHEEENQIPAVLNISEDTVVVGKIIVDLNEYKHPTLGAINKANPIINITGGVMDSIETVGETKAVEEGVSGGSFAEAVPEDLCAEGFEPTVNANGMYGVVVEAPNAKIGEVTYDTVEKALESAKSGDVIKVVANSIENRLIVKSGVTLDLGSHTVQASYLIALNGSTITGATMEDETSGAKLIVPQGSIAVTNGKAAAGENGWSVIPVYADGAYTFARTMIYNPTFVKNAEAGTAKVEFVPTFNKYVKQNVFNDGCEDNDVAIIIRVVYMEGDIKVTREYYYTTPMVKASMLNNQSMFAEMTGCNDLTDLEFTIAIVSDSGVALESQTYTY